ncbi:MAG: hypothetical protein HRU26_12535 [Psychroserpens sp.]|nr:hypothetical protein [Psychroserpens sp.]
MSKNLDFTEIVGEYGKVSIFEHIIDDEDPELGTYKSQNKLDFGNGDLTIDNEHIANRRTVYEAPFGSTINIVSFTNTLYVPQIRWLDADGERDVKPVPRILLVITGTTVEELTGGEFEDVTIGSTVQDDLPFAWFVKAPYTITTDTYIQSLSFGDITFTENVEGTLTEYWTEYQEVLSNIKYLTADFKLNSVDIIENDFTIPVYIDRFKSYFYINSINEFSGSDQLTEVELIKIA